MKKLLSLVLLVCLLLLSAVPANAVAPSVPQNGLEIAPSLQETLDSYFDLRCNILMGEYRSTSDYETILALLSTSQSVSDSMLSRLSAKDNLATYHNVHVIDCSIRTNINSIEEIESGVYEVTIYEWTQICYNDGKSSSFDELGYGTHHTMILRLCGDGSFKIEEDIFDDSAFVGVRSFEDASVSNSVQVISTPSSASLTGINSTRGLFVDDLIEYANTWVSHANEDTGDEVAMDIAYYNTTQYGYYHQNDCANFVSQCLRAGGMQYDYGSGKDNKNWDGTQWWFDEYPDITFENYEVCPNSWRLVGKFIEYWTNQGYMKVPATATTVFAGNPVINNSGHVGICVGYNNSGTPIINAHTSDVYQVPYTMIGDGTITTIQIIRMKHDTHTSCTYASKDIHSHICKCTDCGENYYEAHTWVALGSSYRCSVCLMTSSYIPVAPSNIPENVLAKIQQAGLKGDFALSIDADTVLCSVDGQYYLVKECTEDMALQLVCSETNAAQ